MTDEKVQTGVNLDKIVHEYLSKQDLSNSEYINRVMNHEIGAENGAGSVTAIDVQLERAKTELENMEADLEAQKQKIKRQEQQIEEIEELRDGVSVRSQRDIDRANEMFHKIGPLSLSTQNVEHWAGEVGVTPEELIDELPDFEPEDLSYEVQEQYFKDLL